MSETYYDELDFVREADDDIFPEFLFSPIFNDFDDGYYEKSFAMDETTAMIKRLRRRYNNFYEWCDAMDVYHEYVNLLVEKYGSMSIIKNSIKMGTLDETLPGKPKLKSTKRNKQFLRSGVIPSRELIDPLTPQEMRSLIQETFPDKTGDFDENKSQRIPKSLQKAIDKMHEEIEGKDRRRNLYRSVGSNSGTDFIVEYLNQAKQGVYDSSGKYTGESSRSISEIAKEMEYIEKTDPDRLLDESSDTSHIKNGRLVYRKNEEMLDLYKILYEEGINLLGSLSKSMDKKSVKMIRSQIGATEPMTKKEMRKMKKRARKERDIIEKRKDQSELLERTLLGNKINLERKGNSLSMRLKDIYRD